MSKKIFFSYCTADEEFVNNVFKDIKSKNSQLKIFKFNQQNYDSTQAWAEIDKNINESNIYFIFISRFSLQSKSVIAELYAALHKSINSQKNQFKIVPIIIDNYSYWENNSPFVKYPLLDSITRIEDFSRDFKTLSQYILDNLEKDQWPPYVPNFKFFGVLINTEIFQYLSDKEKIKTKILILYSNIDVEKISFIYKTKLDFIRGKGNHGMSTSGTFRFMNPFLSDNGERFNLLQVNNDSIEKEGYFRWNFEEGSFFKKNDDILKIYIEVSKNKFYLINLSDELTIQMEELDSSKELSITMEELRERTLE